MPRLCRLRLVSIGHPSARFSDVTLDFRDGDGRATHSTLWLRNGGGKSSLLNLFFAGVRPNRREFLGTKGETGKRKLEDYVLAGDSALVVCEWELDAAAGTLELGETGHFITGVFFERVHGSRSGDGDGQGAETGDLRRLFFACLALPTEPRLTLEGLPLFAGQGSQRSRRRLSSFRQEWLSLRDQYPQQEIAAIDDNQRSWQELLNSRGIDPELYFYQVRMNEREGGADQIFVFEDAEDFCDFLLGMVLNPEEVKPVRDNVASFREQLLRRTEQLVPEQELCRGLMVPLTGMSEIWRNRTQLRADAHALAQRCMCLRILLQGRLQHWQNVAGEAAATALEQQAAARQTREEGANANRRAAVMLQHYWRHRLKDAEAILGAAQTTMQEAAQAEAVWEAAIPLQQALQHEGQAAAYRDQLRQKRVDWAPLLDELQKAGTGLAAALRGASDTLRSSAGCKRKEAENASRLADEHDQHAREATGAAAGAQAKAEELQHRLKAGQEARESLQAAAVILPAETASEALQRIAGHVHVIDGQGEVIRQELPRIDKALRDASEAKQAAAIEETAIVTDCERVNRSLQAAQSKRVAIEQNDALRRLLDLEQLDLSRCLDQAIARSIDERRRTRDQIIDLRLQAAASDRALQALEEQGLLPPSPDVQAVVDLLRPTLRAVWSGWEYIAENYRTNEERRALVGRLPHVACGILVRPDDLGKVRTLLTNASLSLAEPVVVASLAALAGDGVGEILVVGPSSDAHFDRSAAARELNHLRTIGDQRGHEEQRLQAWQVTVDQVERQLERFRDDHPPGWFDTQRQHLEQAHAKLEAVRARLADAEKQISRLTARQVELHTAERALAQELRQVDIAKTKVEQYQRDHERYHEAYALERTRQLEVAKVQHAQAEDLQASAKEARSRAQEFSTDAQRFMHQAENFENERGKIRYGAKDAAPSPAPVDQLRFAYEDLRSQYEQRVGAEALEALASQEDTHAVKVRERLGRILQESPEITIEIVAEELRRLPPNQPVDARHREAKNAHWTAKQATGSASQVRGRIAESSTQAESRYAQLAETGLLETVDDALAADEALKIAEDAEVQAKSLTAEADLHAERQAKLEAESMQAAHRAEILAKDAEALATTTAASEGILPSIDGETPESTLPQTVEDESFTEHIKQIAIDANGLRSSHQELDQKRAGITARVRQIARDAKYASLKNSVAPRFGEFEDAALESRSEQLIQELQLRVQTIQADIDEADQHRDLVIRQTLSAAEDALRSLRSAAASSRLPDTLAYVGGKQFLRITTSEPTNPAEKRSRVTELIESLIAQGEIPNEVKLVQMAVRRLGRPIHVRVLHPDPDRAGDTVDITEMNRLSGGERLTGAILLYCTLAQLRSRNRGQLRRPSSVLLLDNPIGRASRPRFIEMQREFAEQMQVQLVYATGVNDLEAISILPNQIRLRNDRVDRNSGHHLVEHLPAGVDQAGIIEAVRVGRVVSAADTLTEVTKPGEREEDHVV